MKVPKVVKYLRYSGFLVLYPIGILGECLCMWQAVQLFNKSEHFKHWPYPMPNRANFELSLKTFYMVMLLAYIPGGAHMYTHMLTQRKKALSRKNTKAA